MTDFENKLTLLRDEIDDIDSKLVDLLAQRLAVIAGAALGRPAKVINIGSIDGLRLNPWETYSYHASKAAILFLTKRMAARLISDNIVVTAIAPGAFPSDMNRSARDRAEEAASVIPAKRIGRSEDIAAAAVYLASEAGDYVVGEALTVDGGMVHAVCGPGADL